MKRKRWRRKKGERKSKRSKAINIFPCVIHTPEWQFEHRNAWIIFQYFSIKVNALNVYVGIKIGSIYFAVFCLCASPQNGKIIFFSKTKTTETVERTQSPLKRLLSIALSLARFIARRIRIYGFQKKPTQNNTDMCTIRYVYIYSCCVKDVRHSRYTFNATFGARLCLWCWCVRHVFFSLFFPFIGV